jgi:hypothetical protein
MAAECPGYQNAGINAVLLGHTASRSDGVLPPLSIDFPSDQELHEALSLGHSVDYGNSSECFRVLLSQNSVLLRDCIANRQLRAKQRGPNLSGQSSLEQSFVGSQHQSNQSSVSAPLSDPAESSSSSSNAKRARLSASVSPPAYYQCPQCHQWYNEKDFDRHVSHWIVKSAQIGPVKPKSCPGIRDPCHNFLSHFDGETHIARVTQLVLDIRSMLRPGAYDALSPKGSGRHVNIGHRFQFLSHRANIYPD